MEALEEAEWGWRLVVAVSRGRLPSEEGSKAGRGTEQGLDLTSGGPHETSAPSGCESLGHTSCRLAAQRQQRSVSPPHRKTPLLTGSVARSGTQMRSVEEEKRSNILLNKSMRTYIWQKTNKERVLETDRGGN